MKDQGMDLPALSEKRPDGLSASRLFDGYSLSRRQVSATGGEQNALPTESLLSFETQGLYARVCSSYDFESYTKVGTENRELAIANLGWCDLQEYGALWPAEKALRQRVEQNCTHEQSEEMLRLLRDFEKRKKADGVSSIEISDTLKGITRILENRDRSVVTQEERVLLALDALREAGRPHDIDQGKYNTCNVTVLCERLFTRKPSKAVHILESVVSTGAWHADDGKLIILDKESLTPAPESCTQPVLDGDRSYATQLLNIALVNDASQRRNPCQFYKQVVPDSPFDNVERLTYANGREVMTYGPKGFRPARTPEMPVEEIQQVEKRLFGYDKTCVANASISSDKSIRRINSVEDLEKALIHFKERHKFPATIVVDANNACFLGISSSVPGWHVVSVTNYDVYNQEVEVSNEWGRFFDKKMTLQELYDSTLPVRWTFPPKFVDGV
jgi:hypothetical protein